MPMHVTAHAVARYQERVALVTDEQAIAALSSPAFDIARLIGASVVKLGTGHRAVCKNGSVVTVLPKGRWVAA